MRLVQLKTSSVAPIKKGHGIRNASLLVVTIFAIGSFNYFRPLPGATISLDLPPAPAPSAPNIAWPAVGTATFTAVGYDFTLSNADVIPVSTASMAKVITALCVLEKRPLKLGETGPTLTMTADDVLRLQQQYDQGGSHLVITEGEKITEYQMLQAMLLPSANNIADSLAVWAFGSLAEYQKYAQDFVLRQGMHQTHIGPDASGFDPATTSTTSDLTLLGKAALKNTVIMQIAGTEKATFETAGEVENTNTFLSNGILTGLKTGSNEGNSGGFIFTSIAQKVAHPIQIVGAIVDAGSSRNAVMSAEELAKSAADNFEAITYTKAGQKIGTAQTAWGSSTAIIAKSDTTVIRWKANKIWHVEQLEKNDATRNGTVGTLAVRTNGSKSTTALTILTPASEPSIWWRISHFR